MDGVFGARRDLRMSPSGGSAVASGDGRYAAPVATVGGAGASCSNAAFRATSGLDFEAKGQVFFVLEPLCIPFEVDFTVGRRAGVWAVECTGGRQAWFPGSD